MPDDVDVISLYNRRNTDEKALFMWERSVCFTRNLHKGGAVAYIVTRKGMNKFAAADPGGCGLLQLQVADAHLFGPGVTCVGVGFTLVTTRNDRKGNDSTLHMSHTSQHLARARRIMCTYNQAATPRLDRRNRLDLCVYVVVAVTGAIILAAAVAASCLTAMEQRIKSEENALTNLTSLTALDVSS